MDMSGMMGGMWLIGLLAIVVLALGVAALWPQKRVWIDLGAGLPSGKLSK